MSGVQSIERAFAVLRALSTGPAGVTDLAERTGLPKSTVSRLLAALEREGAVARAGSGGHYRLGPVLAELAPASAPGLNLAALARPHLTELTRLTGETSGLAVLDGHEVVYLDHVDSEEAVTVRDRTGERIPAHLVPSGLALLAHAPPAAVDAYLAGAPVQPATDRTVTSPAAIRARLDEVRRQGWIWFHREVDDSLCSVAAPVVRADGTAVAALHVHGPAYRFPGEAADEAAIGRALRATADRLAAQLG
ncbi:MAG: IclR family transcriptional regulator [Acidimicrobiales bacterium]